MEYLQGLVEIIEPSIAVSMGRHDGLVLNADADAVEVGGAVGMRFRRAISRCYASSVG